MSTTYSSAAAAVVAGPTANPAAAAGPACASCQQMAQATAAQQCLTSHLTNLHQHNFSTVEKHRRTASGKLTLSSDARILLSDYCTSEKIYLASGSHDESG